MEGTDGGSADFAATGYSDTRVFGFISKDNHVGGYADVDEVTGETMLARTASPDRSTQNFSANRASDLGCEADEAADDAGLERCAIRRRRDRASRRWLERVWHGRLPASRSLSRYVGRRQSKLKLFVSAYAIKNVVSREPHATYSPWTRTSAG